MELDRSWIGVGCLLNLFHHYPSMSINLSSTWTTRLDSQLPGVVEYVRYICEGV